MLRSPPMGLTSQSDSSSPFKASIAEQSSATSNSQPPSGGGDSGEQHQRKRRLTGHVSLIACTECRHARAKCDGVRPDPCSRCVSRNVRCVYELHSRTRKEDLLHEAEQVKRLFAGLKDEHQRLQESTTKLVKETKEAQDESEWQRVILDILGNNGHDHEIVKRLKSGESHQSIADWLIREPSIERHLYIVPRAQRDLVSVTKRVEEYYGGREELAARSSPGYCWTNVNPSPTLITHLFDLYFTWVHPVHMLFSEQDFMDSFHRNDTSYCSSALVNAICAMACHLLDGGLDSNDLNRGDAVALREGYMSAARAHLPADPYLSATATQAFAVMYLVDLSSGRARAATAYLRCAADSLRAVDGGRQTKEALELSGWGIQTLNTAWAGLTYQKPFAPESPFSIVFQNVSMDSDGTSWHFYQQPSDGSENKKRPSFATLTAFFQAKLYRIIHETINVYCGARGRITAHSVVECYRRFLGWRHSLPEEIRNLNVEVEQLPHILYLHVQYHTAVVNLFTPVAYSDVLFEKDAEAIRKAILFHARSGLEILRQAARLYSSRYNLPLIAFCALHLGDAMIRNNSPSDPSSAQAAEFVLDVLRENGKGFAICGPLQQLFRRSVAHYGVRLDEAVDERLGFGIRYSVDDILDACTRVTYTQPTDQIVRYLDRSTAENWHDEWLRLMEETRGEPEQEISSERYLQINSLLNV